MNLFAVFHQKILATLEALVAEGVLVPQLGLQLDFSRVTAEPPRDASHGDIATNAALVVAKAAGLSPKALALHLVPKLESLPDVAKVHIAGPGFINLTLRERFWPLIPQAVLAQGANYGRSQLGAGHRTNVEYVSANPTGPLHVGHCRGAVFGDALANLLETTGYDVTREYYINDAGAQVDVLGRSAYLRYCEALGQDIGEIPEGLYPGHYLKPVGKALAQEYGRDLLNRPEAEWLPIVRDKAIAMMMDLIRADLASLHIRHEQFFSEKSLYSSGQVQAIVQELSQADLIYKGRLPPPKGEVPEDWEDREQTLFRATRFGDDMDRPLQKSDESYTYFASDIAYTAHKINRGYDQLVYILGADHGGYVKRLEAVAAALAHVTQATNPHKIQVVVRLCQLVKLYRDGEPVRMSKRAGSFVTLRDVVEEVGADVVRFMMLYRKNEAPLDFDFAKVTEQSKDNPVFYVQYAHARISSVLRMAATSGYGKPEAVAQVDFTLLNDASEMALIRRLAEYPRLLEAAALSHEPHRVAFFLYELASEFHALWNKGKELPHLRFIVHNTAITTETRLAFLQAIRYVLANGLRILGVNPVDEM